MTDLLSTIERLVNATSVLSLDDRLLLMTTTELFMARFAGDSLLGQLRNHALSYVSEKLRALKDYEAMRVMARVPGFFSALYETEATQFLACIIESPIDDYTCVTIIRGASKTDRFVRFVLDQKMPGDFRTPLALAVSERKFRVMKYLIELGADPNGEDRPHIGPQQYPLDCAAWRVSTNPEYMYALFDAGATRCNPGNWPGDCLEYFFENPAVPMDYVERVVQSLAHYHNDLATNEHVRRAMTDPDARPALKSLLDKWVSIDELRKDIDAVSTTASKRSRGEDEIEQ